MASDSDNIVWEFPPKPKIKKILNGDYNTFFCDHCSIKKTICDDQEESLKVINTSASFLQKRNLESHCKTKKHLEALEHVKKAIEEKTSITCKYCNETFTKEGYDRHRERNNMLWLIGNKEYGSCNNIYYSKCRFPNTEYLKNYINSQDNYKWRAIKFKRDVRRLKENKLKKPPQFVIDAIERRLKELGAIKKERIEKLAQK